MFRPKTYRVWVFLRKTPKNKSPEIVAQAAKEIREGLLGAGQADTLEQRVVRESGVDYDVYAAVSQLEKEMLESEDKTM